MNDGPFVLYGMSHESYYIWSEEHAAWWAPNEMGYTHCLLEAGIYSPQDTVRILANAAPGHEYAFPTNQYASHGLGEALPNRREL